jgi:hypothetical protein
MSLADELIADLEELENDQPLIKGTNPLKITTVYDIIKILNDPTMVHILNEIDKFTKNPTNINHLGSIEEHPEYEIIVKSNNLITDLDNEILAVNKVS